MYVALVIHATEMQQDKTWQRKLHDLYKQEEEYMAMLAVLLESCNIKLNANAHNKNVNVFHMVKFLVYRFIIHLYL